MQYQLYLTRWSGPSIEHATRQTSRQSMVVKKEVLLFSTSDICGIEQAVQSGVPYHRLQ